MCDIVPPPPPSKSFAAWRAKPGSQFLQLLMALEARGRDCYTGAQAFARLSVVPLQMPLRMRGRLAVFCMVGNSFLCYANPGNSSRPQNSKESFPLQRQHLPAFQMAPRVHGVVLEMHGLVSPTPTGQATLASPESLQLPTSIWNPCLKPIIQTAQKGLFDQMFKIEVWTTDFSELAILKFASVNKYKCSKCQWHQSPCYMSKHAVLPESNRTPFSEMGCSFFCTYLHIHNISWFWFHIFVPFKSLTSLSYTQFHNCCNWV